MLSINTRLLLASSVIMTGFLAVTGITLDQAYRKNAEHALKDKLHSYVIAMISTIELQPDGSIAPPQHLADIRYSIPFSGLYAEIRHNRQGIIWRSSSAYGRKIPFLSNLARGEKRFEPIRSNSGENLYCFSFGVSWDVTASRDQVYTISVAESPEVFNANLASYRQSLWSWLGTLGIILLIVQTLMLRWGLRSLRDVSDDLKAIENGSKYYLEGSYPPELRRLTDNLNALLETQHEHLQRYRNTLGDLAHSLKTPLAMIRGSVETDTDPDHNRQIIREQVEHMNEIILYQLQRAATAGRTALASPLELVPRLEKIVRTLHKVNGDKTIDCQLDIPTSTQFYGDEGDLMELTGNLLDNAFKWGQRRIRVSAANASERDRREGLRLVVEDDGPGIAPGKIEEVLQRGMRADESTHGHGIGMAIVRDIVTAYGGKIQISRSELGGAKIDITFPPNR